MISKKLDKSSMDLEGIRKWVQTTYAEGGKYKYKKADWPKDLWTWKYKEITNWLESRFRTTIDEQEYYGIMPYLLHVIEDKELFIRFKDVIRFDPEKGPIRKRTATRIELTGEKSDGRITSVGTCQSNGISRIPTHRREHVRRQTRKNERRSNKDQQVQGNVVSKVRKH